MFQVTNPTTLKWLGIAIADFEKRAAPEVVVAFTEPYSVGIYAVRIPEFNYAEYEVDLNVPAERRVDAVVYEKWPPPAIGDKWPPCVKTEDNFGEVL
jgi:hypothetical protein